MARSRDRSSGVPEAKRESIAALELARIKQKKLIAGNLHNWIFRSCFPPYLLNAVVSGVTFTCH